MVRGDDPAGECTGHHFVVMSSVSTKCRALAYGRSMTTLSRVITRRQGLASLNFRDFRAAADECGPLLAAFDCVRGAMNRSDGARSRDTRRARARIGKDTATASWSTIEV